MATGEKKDPTQAGVAELRGSSPAVVWLCGIAVVALVVRLSYLKSMITHPIIGVLANDPVLDSRFYIDFAVQLREQGWVSDHAFFAGPLYSYFLALLQTVGGTSTLAIYAAQCLLGVLNCILIYFLGRALDRPGAGLVGAAMAAVYSPFVFFENQVLMAIPLATLVLVFVNLALRRLRRGSPLGDLGLGVLLGILVGFRGTFLVFAPVVVLFFLGREWNRIGRIAVQRILPFALGVSLPILGLWLHNVATGDAGVVLASNFGLNLFIGNHEGASGRFRTEIRLDEDGAVVPLTFGRDSEPRLRAFVSRRLGREASPSEVSRFFAARALDYIVKNPGEFLFLTAKRIWMFWNRIEISQVYDYYFYRRQLGAWQLWLLQFWLVSALAVLGGIRLGISDLRVNFLYAVLGVYVLAVSLFIINARYRIPVLGLIIILAAVGATELYRMLCGPQRPPRATIAATLVPVLLFAAAESPPAARTEPWQMMNNIGLNLMEMDRDAEAEMFLRRAFDLSPNRIVLGNLTLFYSRLGRPESAADLLDGLLETNSKLPEVRMQLLGLYLQNGRQEDALRQAFLGIEHTPSALFYASAGGILGRMKRHADSYAVSRQGLALFPGDGDIEKNLASALKRSRTEDPELARQIEGLGQDEVRRRVAALVEQYASDAPAE